MAIFERKLTLFTARGSHDVLIAITSPTQRDQSWFADWEICWPDRKRNGSAGGTDAIQALVSSLKMIGSEIYCSDEHKTGQLRWGNEYLGYGFPVPAGIRDMMIGDDVRYF